MFSSTADPCVVDNAGVCLTSNLIVSALRGGELPLGGDRWVRKCRSCQKCRIQLHFVGYCTMLPYESKCPEESFGCLTGRRWDLGSELISKPKSLMGGRLPEVGPYTLVKCNPRRRRTQGRKEGALLWPFIMPVWYFYKGLLHLRQKKDSLHLLVAVSPWQSNVDLKWQWA